MKTALRGVQGVSLKMSEKRCVSTNAPLMVLTQDASPLLILFYKVTGYRVLLFLVDQVNL